MDDYFPTVFQEQYPSLVIASTTGSRMTHVPTNVTTEISLFPSLIASSLQEVLAKPPRCVR